MTMPTDNFCEEFDQGVDELAVGTLGEPERSRLLDHAASCPACEARLNELAGLADRLLLLVPEVEPPAGFEAGALARMGGEAADRDTRPERAGNRSPGRARDGDPAVTGRRAGARAAAARVWQNRSWRMVAVAAVAVAVLAAGVALGRTSNRSKPAAVARQGEIMTAAGADVGTVQLLSTPEPHVVVSLTSPLPWGVLSCQLELAQGRRVTVGSWAYDDNPDGTWATRIDRSLTGAVRMRIVDQQGTVVATASLT